MISVTSLWRHPIKSHGREALTETTLTAGQALPWDRHWAVRHDHATEVLDGWSSCRNFMIGTRTPTLAGLWARLDTESGSVHLRHAELGEHVVRPDDATDVRAFFDWISPLTDGASVQPKEIVVAGARGMTDTDYASVSIMNTASHDAVAHALGGALEAERWRGNIWLDGPAAWTEFDWIGRRLKIGGAVVEIKEPIRRCLHTAANPRTGERDADTLATLNGTFGHQDFGVYAVVTQGGTVALGDTCEVIG